MSSGNCDGERVESHEGLREYQPLTWDDLEREHDRQQVADRYARESLWDTPLFERLGLAQGEYLKFLG